MKDPIAKLYAKMTPDELASLAIKTVCTPDMREEGRRIAGFVPRVQYIGADLDYMRKVAGFFSMLECWAKVAWATRYHREKAFSLSLSFLLHPHIDAEGKTLLRTADEMVRLESCLLAIDGALDAVCASMGVDPDEVRALCVIERFEPLEPFEGGLATEPDPETFEWMTQTLTEHLAGKYGGFGCADGHQ
nr:hypothetical protein [Ferrovum sp.]